MLVGLAPVFRAEAKRFITLIDALYDAKIKLILSVAAEPDTLGAELEGAEKFEFARTASRLVEMHSLDYRTAAHEGRVDAGDLGGLIETRCAGGRKVPRSLLDKLFMLCSYAPFPHNGFPP